MNYYVVISKERGATSVLRLIGYNYSSYETMC